MLVASQQSQSILSTILPIIIAITVAVGLWMAMRPDKRMANSWAFDLALVPYTLAKLSSSLDNPSIAIYFLQQSIDTNDEYAPAHDALGYLYYQQGQIAEAATHWTKVTHYDPENAAAYANLAVSLAAENNIAEAIVALEQAIHMSPNMPDFQLALGELYLQQGDMRQARRTLLEASRLDQANSTTFYKLGYLYLMDEQYEKAIYHFEQAYTHNPELHLARQGLGVTYFEQAMFDQALHYFKSGLRQHPDDPISHFYIGLIHEALDNHHLAQQAFHQAKQLATSGVMRQRATEHLTRLAPSQESEALPMAR